MTLLTKQMQLLGRLLGGGKRLGPKERGVFVGSYAAEDSLQLNDLELETPSARRFLEKFQLPGETFPVDVRVPGEHTQCDLLVEFDSPGGSFSPVLLEWYATPNHGAPSALVVHETSSLMLVGRMVAMLLAKRGIHSFLVQLPGYGDRKADQCFDLLPRFVQGVADARRAYDAIQAIRRQDNAQIAIQGTSLGGFLATVTSSLDGCFDSLELALCGGNVFDVLTTGKHDAKELLADFLQTGYGLQRLRAELEVIEPLNLVHRLRRSHTRVHLTTARFDGVVPRGCSDALAAALCLSSRQRSFITSGHYTGVVFLPYLCKRTAKRILGR